MPLLLYWEHFQDPWEYPPHFPAPHWAWSVHQWPQPHLSPAVFTVTCMDTRHTECCLLGAHLVCQLGRETHQTVAAAQACCTLDQPQGWYKLVGCFWVSKSKCNHSWTISHIIYMTQNSCHWPECLPLCWATATVCCGWLGSRGWLTLPTSDCEERNSATLRQLLMCCCILVYK